MPRASRWLLLLVLVLVCDLAGAQGLADLRVGHWVEVKGVLEAKSFTASAIEVLPPSDKHVLIGAVTEVDEADKSFVVLGQPVQVTDKTQWRDVDLSALKGKFVKVEGHYRGPNKFSARQISARGEGRSRIEGRIDAIEPMGEDLELTVMRFKVLVPHAVKFENQGPFGDMVLSPQVDFETLTGRFVSDDDYIPGGLKIGPDLFLGALFEWKAEDDSNFDLDDTQSGDVTKQRVTLRAQLAWTPSEKFRALFSPRIELNDRHRDGQPAEDTGTVDIYEAWLLFGDILGSGVDLEVGRQSFDDLREWIYKKNLDAVRTTWAVENFRIELSASTLLSDGTQQEEDTDNFIAYLSNNDAKRHLAVWVVDRRDSQGTNDWPIFFGARALGDWIPANKSWLEWSLLRGFSNNNNLKGWGFDVGTTYAPQFAEPFYLTAGYAWGTGDDPNTTETNEAFQQTGLQRNNARFGGVTSFRYYGELVDPELSNLGIVTAGIGMRIAPRMSLDLVYHQYRQVTATDFLLDSNLKQDPDGLDADIGREFDLVFGFRAQKFYDLEVVLSHFQPGDAYPNADDAFLAAIQLRFRF